MIQNYNTDPPDHLVAEPAEPAPPDEPTATHKVVVLGREKFRGTYFECDDFIRDDNKGCPPKTSIRFYGYKIKEI